MDNVTIGIIGGSGIYELENMKMIDSFEIKTPFGSPSDKYMIGSLNGIKIAFLSRHGKGHRILPSELNNRANIYGFKTLGVKYLIGISAVGSLREEIKPSHLVFPNQIIDRTKGRIATFFGEGIVAHVSFAKPFCPHLTSLFKKHADMQKIQSHADKTYICMEGPLFSTQAESHYHRSIGGDLIGMTAVPEAKLAREAEMCYGTIALSTDYDCWREDEEAVNTDMIVETINKNIQSAKKLLSSLIPDINYSECSCHKSLENSFMTAKEYWPETTKKNLEILIKRFL